MLGALLEVGSLKVGTIFPQYPRLKRLQIPQYPRLKRLQMHFTGFLIPMPPLLQ
jgi:hypothetical protein